MFTAMDYSTGHDDATRKNENAWGPARMSTEGVTVVVVSYNSGMVIAACLEALPADVRVIVVDNASTDDSREVAVAARRGVEIVRNPANVGPGTAANQGFQLATSEFGLFLTPDTVLAPGALERLLAAAETYPDAGLLAPFLVHPERGLELSLCGPGELAHSPPAAVPEAPFCTWFFNCAAVLTRLADWRRIGGFDEAIFLYHEDMDLCLRMRESGRSLIVVTEAEARHLGGHSAKPTNKVRWLKDWHSTWSRYYVEAKHGDAGKTRAEARAYAWRMVLKTLLYIILIRPARVQGNAAKAWAAIAFLLGRPSH